MAIDQVSEDSVTDDMTSTPKKIGPFTVRRWIALLFFVVLAIFLMRPILDPYNEDGYMVVPHGDHVHYVPADRDPNVDVSSFPTREPGPDERITPDGRIVKK